MVLAAGALAAGALPSATRSRPGAGGVGAGPWTDRDDSESRAEEKIVQQHWRFMGECSG